MGVYRRKIRGKPARDWNAKFMFRRRLYQQGGFPDRDTAQHWIDTTRAKLRRGEMGYSKPQTSAHVLPLITEYGDSLRAAGRKEMYVKIAEWRLQKLAREIPWMTLADLNPLSMEQWRNRRPKWRKRTLKPKTTNQYLDHADEFGEWLFNPRRLLSFNPLAGVRRANAPTNDDYRRAGTLEELRKLLTTSPPDRRIVYLFASYIPLRRGSLERITWRDVELSGDRPTLTVLSEDMKTARKVKLAIPPPLVKELEKHRGNAAADEKVFPRVPDVPTIRKDLETAGVQFDDGKGKRRLDLHAFRKTVTRILKDAGVDFEQLHVFLQHKDERTTRKYYDDDRVAPAISRAAEKMPDLTLSMADR